MQESGYVCAAYAESLCEFGTPRRLEESGGWILERAIPGSSLRDAIGCYPIFSCSDWSKLHLDLENMGDELISLSMVPDPFGDYEVAYLNDCFKDLVTPFKQHYVIDMERSLDETVSRHHKKAIRQAQRKIQTEVCHQPLEILEDWLALHQRLVSKHSIRGIRAFSRRAFEQQLQTPGVVVLLAKYNEEIVGIQLWFQHQDVAFGHVLAFSDVGYRLKASYALYWFALNYFSDKVRWCDLGGVAGNTDHDANGLHQFKAGWSTGKKTAYLCGRILNASVYQELVTQNGRTAGYFPAYRKSF